MLKSKGFLVLGIVFMLSGVSLTSCGNNGDGNILTIGVECEYSPFNWASNQSSSNTLAISGQSNLFADGYDLEIAKLVAQDIGYEIVVKKIEWTSLITSLNSGGINCIFSGMSYTAERDLSVDFTSNYYTSAMTVIVKKGGDLANITSIQQLSGKRVVSQLGTLTDTIIDQIDGVSHATALSTFGDCALSVSTGANDAMTAEYPVARAICNANSNLTLINFTAENGFQNLDNNELGVAAVVADGNNELREKLDTSIKKITDETRQSLMDQCILRSPGN